MLKKIAEWREETVLNEMAARRSLMRAMGKFQGNLDRPVAILTAFRQEFDLKTNRAANKKLQSLLKQHGLSFFPVVGSGQEPDGENPTAEEESYVVQPITPTVGEEEFVNLIRSLLFNPTGDDSGNHVQWGAVVKLPSRPDAFLLHHSAPDRPFSPKDYSSEFSLGKSARLARKTDANFTQMLKGPRLNTTMQSAADAKRTRPPGLRFVADD